jgi:hypothetical protein
MVQVEQWQETRISVSTTQVRADVGALRMRVEQLRREPFGPFIKIPKNDPASEQPLTG